MKQIDEMTEIIGALRFHNTSDYIAERLYNAGYRKQSEVAREILEEIEKNFEVGYGGALEFRGLLAELKKKYTEGKDE